MKDFISWLGTVTSIVGSFVVAFGFLKIGFSLFLIGSVSWCLVGIIRREISLYTLNGFFICANVIGLYRAFS